jgi:hypothetical protein
MMTVIIMGNTGIFSEILGVSAVLACPYWRA